MKTKKKATVWRVSDLIKPHKWKRYGYVIVHDKNTKITFNAFDIRYTGPKSAFGKYVRRLHTEGVDVSELTLTKIKDKETEDLTIVIAKRLHAALTNRTITVSPQAKTGSNQVKVVRDEDWDWKSPLAKRSRYYRMAEHLLENHDHETVLQIVNVITGNG